MGSAPAFVIIKKMFSILDKKIIERAERGVVVLNKKAGVTSHDEVFQLKKLLNKNFRKKEKVKVGHSGTLDPKVTGVLVCGTGKGTRLMEYMLMSDKQYVGEILFHQKVEREDFEKIAEEFVGKIKQTPPVKSSVKREEREREIYKIEILEFGSDGRKATLFCSVERGTYIRKLFHDMGEKLGIVASMGDLHRVKAGPFLETETKTVKVDDLEGLVSRYKKTFNLFKKIELRSKILELIQPMENAVVDFKKIYLKKGITKYLKNGGDLFAPGVESVNTDIKKGEVVCIFDEYKKLVVMAEAAGDFAFGKIPQKGLIAKTKKVLI